VVTALSDCVFKPAESFVSLLVVLVSLAVNGISAPSFKDEVVAEYEKVGDITVYCCYPPSQYHKYDPDIFVEDNKTNDVQLLYSGFNCGISAAPQDGPVSITAEFNVDPTRRNECVELMRDARLIFLRNCAYRWHLYEDLNQPNKFRMEVVVPSWKQHLLQRERMTKTEKDILLKLRSQRIDPNPPEEWISLSVEKEVLNRRVGTGGLPQSYIDR
jgi:Transmembrane secretion effector